MQFQSTSSLLPVRFRTIALKLKINISSLRHRYANHCCAKNSLLRQKRAVF